MLRSPHLPAWVHNSAVMNRRGRMRARAQGGRGGGARFRAAAGSGDVRVGHAAASPHPAQNSKSGAAGNASARQPISLPQNPGELVRALALASLNRIRRRVRRNRGNFFAGELAPGEEIASLQFPRPEMRSISAETALGASLAQTTRSFERNTVTGLPGTQLPGSPVWICQLSFSIAAFTRRMVSSLPSR